ncbi:ABC transporter ATP-binding protein [Holdemanella biformis]|jgi:ABC-type polysaccharide/polyol phosphate transport system ATPase subunit|uniref:ABC transporter ATP-binding protein n=1 Tax=Holdemanella biformis TaxID=1735 RepID=UPI0022E4B25C|nr:ABC transporter ATP-binding protein [Holdemanella biformis]
MDSRNAIEVRNMSKYFKVEYDKANTLKDKLLHWNRHNVERHQVLNNINLNIRKGETVALIGTNGSGKSTLLKLMTKIIFPNTGEITTNGKLTSLLELGAGFHQDFTGRENIYFNASIFGLTRKDIEARIDDIIEFSELGTFIDNPVRTYSSGMYMRLAFSVAINVDADILLIDEILAVGDQHFQDKCYKKLEELKNSGKTIVIVTHSLDVVKKLCHRAIWIYKGEVRLDGDPVYVIDEYLDQVAKDHKEERKKAIESGKGKGRASITIDHPRDFSRIELSDDNIKFDGWAITDDENAKLIIQLDDELVEYDLSLRRDVYEVYKEIYAGFIDENKIGWIFFKDKKEIGVGEHKLTVKYVDSNGDVLDEKDCQFKILNEVE